MLSVSSRIWTRVTVSISYDDNHYTTGTSQVLLCNSYNLTSVICFHIVCTIWPRDGTVSGATTPVQSGPRSKGNEEVLCIPQSSKARALPSDSLMSHPGNSLGRSYPSIYEQSAYYATSADRVLIIWFWSRDMIHRSQFAFNTGCCLIG